MQQPSAPFPMETLSLPPTQHILGEPGVQTLPILCSSQGPVCSPVSSPEPRAAQVLVDRGSSVYLKEHVVGDSQGTHGHRQS